MTADRLTYIRAGIRHATGPRTHDVIDVGWLPGEGWWCGCGGRGCGHVDVVKGVLG